MLYEQDGLDQSSQLADGLCHVGSKSPASPFTPTIDILERKGLIQRGIHHSNRRSVSIYLTAEGKAIEKQVTASASRIENKIRQQLSEKEWQIYERVIENLQVLTPAEITAIN